MSDRRCDVLVVGAGPAGLALARDCVRRGLGVTVADPRGDAAWQNTFGTWVDDLDDREDATVLRGAMRVSWPTVRVVGHRERLLARPYGFFDNEKLRLHLSTGDVLRSTIVEVVRDREGDVLIARGDDGSRIEAKVVVDAGGPESSLLARHRSHGGGVQSALGVVTRDAPPALRQGFTLMDWSIENDDPTFLYAVDFGDGAVLIEETSLFRSEPMSDHVLRQRLERRFVPFSIAAESTERVDIPMGGGIPTASSTVVGFGAAAGFVHPVTGYSVAASLRASGRVALRLSDSIAARSSVDERVRGAWDAVWPADLRLTRALHEYGLSALGRMGPRELKSFFDAFFALQPNDWTAYLRIDTPPRAIARVMTKFFMRLPGSLRLRVMAANPLALLRGR